MENKNEKYEKYDKYIGRVLDSRYELVKCIGEGSSAVVFKADDLRTGRPVAVKVLKPEQAKDVKAVKSFENECKVISMLDHPSVVKVVEVSIGVYSRYIVMEYIDGITLRNYMDVEAQNGRRRPLSFEEIMEFCEQILSALEHAHSKGIIHRDIKPQNIMLLPKGFVKITDFGIAQVNDDAISLLSDRAAGTAYYISPEQAACGDVDARSDIYSLGVMMYEMATGRLPFEGKDPMSVAKKQITEAPIPPSELNPDIPKGLEAMILMAMEKMPDARFKDASEMLKYLYKIKSRPNAIPRISEKRKRAQNKAPLEKVKPSGSTTPVIWGVACALLFLAIIAGYYILSNLFFADKSNLVSKEVPDFVGMIYTEDGLEFDNRFFVLDTDSIIFEYNEDAPANTIIEQSPRGGSFEKVIANSKKCVITLTVSLGPKMNTMEDFSLVDYRTAEIRLRQLGFRVKLVYEYNRIIGTGLVISTVPAVGEQIIEGSEVTLIVSSGYQAGDLSVPNFVGLTEVEAQKLLTEKGIKVGSVRYTRSGSPVGVVISQSLEEGNDYGYRNVTVDLIISGGLSYDTNYIPDVRGLSRTAAQKLLWNFGISVGSINLEKSSKDENTVISQTYSGWSVPSNLRIIDLTVSGGPDYTPSWIVVRIPSLVGKTLDEARKLLTDNKAAVGEITYVYSDTIPEGQVIAQEDEPGSLRSGYPYNIFVNITVCGGPTPETTEPPVTEPTEPAETNAPTETQPVVSPEESTHPAENRNG
jgi:serine/threonine-protein kinase